jgi:pimeloyl-ACP methyl ester carboxylesterase
VTLARLNGITVHVQVLTPVGAAEPPTAVLVHGLAPDSMASWYFTLAYPLVELGFRVVMADLRGHGRSERPPHGYTLDDFVDDLEALLESYGGPGPYHLFGNSFGGTIAYAYACRHPESVTGIVAIESSPPTATWFGRLRKRLEEHRVPAAVGAGRGELLLSLRPELGESALPDPARLAAITCPVLCLYGGRSRMLELAAETGRLLPHAQTRIFDGQRHSLLIDRPDEVRAAVTTWLNHIGG